MKWKGFEDPADNTWEPFAHLQNNKDLIEKFEKNLKSIVVGHVIDVIIDNVMKTSC